MWLCTPLYGFHKNIIFIVRLCLSLITKARGLFMEMEKTEVDLLVKHNIISKRLTGMKCFSHQFNLQC